MSGAFFQAKQPISNVLADSLYVKTDAVAPLAISNTQSTAVYIQADVTHPIYVALTALPEGASVPVNIVNTILSTKEITTFGVSKNTIHETSHAIAAVSTGDISSMVLTAHIASASFDVNYVKFYNSATATSADTPILKVAIIAIANQSISMTPNITYTNGCCVRATNLWADSDNTSPTANIIGSFLLTL